MSFFQVGWLRHELLSIRSDAVSGCAESCDHQVGGLSKPLPEAFLAPELRRAPDAAPRDPNTDLRLVGFYSDCKGPLQKSRFHEHSHCLLTVALFTANRIGVYSEEANPGS